MTSVSRSSTIWRTRGDREIFFSTAGPIRPNDHYFIPHRLDVPKLRQLLEQQRYFILHAPRQSGKTTAILEFVDQLNNEGKYLASYINIEAAQAARGRVTEGLRTILSRFKACVNYYFPADTAVMAYLEVVSSNPTPSGNSLYEFLQFWSQHSAKPLVLFIDEIDSLVGDTLISVLRQLRDGYATRGAFFPLSICLVGVRDVRDYRIWSDAEQLTILGGSAFNVKAESLLLPNFSAIQVRDLYLQHTAETGQEFTDDAIEQAFYLTQGQPWLVNALAYQACFVDKVDRSQLVTRDDIEIAKEALIKRCDTHIDVLINQLYDPRVRNVIDAVICGQSEFHTLAPDDVQYLRDLGLIGIDSLDIANPIYQEIIPRAIVSTTEARIRESSTFYQNSDGTLNVCKLLEKFADFYRENSATWLSDFQYKESGPHLLLMAFLQRIINGGGTIHREYALDRKRVDLLLSWRSQRIVIELKVKRNRGPLSPDMLLEALRQTLEYMDIANASEGHLLFFDKNLDAPWEQRIYHYSQIVSGKTIEVWGV